MDKQTIVEKISKFPALIGVPREQIEWVVERGELYNIKSGEDFFKKGDTIDTLFIMFEGSISFMMERNGQYMEMGRINAGDISGALPYSRAQSSSANGRVMTDSMLFTLNKSFFHAMICECQDFTEVLVHMMTDRVRSSMKSQQQNEKLMALGKLSAGLAHELNNPAAAIVRSSESLQSHLGTVPDKFKRVISMKVTNEQVDLVNDILFSKIANGVNKSESLMDRTNREDDLTDWLEDNGYGDCFALSETLAEFGFCVDDLEDLQNGLTAETFPSVIEWVDNVLTTEKMVGEIKEASNRISKLVNSVKSYSHMDRSTDFEPTNVHEGLHSTITILNHKFKKNKVSLVENLDTALPNINAVSGELNQVWTNVIDNALDAMEEGGTLELTTTKNAENLMVFIKDSGPGIPEDIQSRIFEPFFTTKDVGKGTGLGLEVVKNIVDRHKGHIRLNSKPGHTEFEFCFPINA
ncbi:ATP-binding protein [Roseivirga sp.]|uniref:ATP-binding protein n=1 Tax=Roseivirga sp. TaxID=1964215 RepID=UPI003B8B5186